MAGSPQRVGDVLGGVIRSLGLEARLDEARAVEAWKEAAGDRVGDATSSVWARGDVLYVQLTSAAWRNELHLEREAWRNRVNERIGRALIREIRFR